MMRTVLSFSGGKDSVLALYRLQQQKIPVVCLITTVWKNNGKTVAHDERTDRIEEQAARLGLPVEWIVTDFENYTTDFQQKLNHLKDMYQLEAVAFGDIYLEGHREWGENLAEATGLEALYPLWTAKEKAIDLLHQFVDAGFKSVIIKIDEKKLPSEWLGREIDESFIQDIVKFDVCPLGESGEYHTFVYDGPNFKMTSD